KLKLIVAAAANPVDIESGPGGDLFYVDFDGGTIRRISYTGTGSTICAKGSFEATYFNNVSLSGTPVVDRCDAAINYDWGTGAPTAGVNADNFSVRWSGNFDFAAGTSTFTATADDGIRVYVDGTLLINAWKDQGPTTYTAPVSLTAGTHAVVVEYYDSGGGA